MHRASRTAWNSLPIDRFDKQKREQELQATKHLDLGSDEGSESDSETEDEDGEMLTPALDLQVRIWRMMPDWPTSGRNKHATRPFFQVARVVGTIATHMCTATSILYPFIASHSRRRSRKAQLR